MPLSREVSDLTTYDLLLSVAALGSLGRAATAHGMSQPAASARLRRLERQVGVVLIQRSPRGSTLTEAGALVADWARAAVDSADALAVGLASLRTRNRGRLRIAASQTVAEYLLPTWLMSLRTARPDSSVSLAAMNSTRVMARVLAGEADLGFIETPEIERGLAAEQVGVDELTVVVAPSHAWARRRSIDLAELVRTPLVTREAGSGTRRYLEDALARQTDAVQADALLELSSTTAIKHAVAAGNGVAVLSSLAVATEIAAGSLRAVAVSGLSLQRQLRAVWPQRRRPDGAASALLGILRRQARAATGRG